MAQSSWLDTGERAFEKPATHGAQFASGRTITDMEAYKEIPQNASAADFRRVVVALQLKQRNLEHMLLNLDTSLNLMVADHVRRFNETLQSMEQFQIEAKKVIKQELERIYQEVQMVLYAEEGTVNLPKPDTAIFEESPIEVGEEPQEENDDDSAN